VLLTYWAALAFVSRRAAVLAAAMMATSILLGVRPAWPRPTRAARHIIAAMGALGRAYMDPGTAAPATILGCCGLFWTAVAAGILLKGR